MSQNASQETCLKGGKIPGRAPESNNKHLRSMLKIRARKTDHVISVYLSLTGTLNRIFTSLVPHGASAYLRLL